MIADKLTFQEHSNGNTFVTDAEGREYTFAVEGYIKTLIVCPGGTSAR